MGSCMPWWIVENTLLAGILALLVALVSRARRVPPVVRHGLWLVVLIKLVVPPAFSLGISMPGTWRFVTQFAEEPRQRGIYEQVVIEMAGPDESAGPPADLRPPLAALSATETFSDYDVASLGSFVPVENPQPALSSAAGPTDSPRAELADVQPLPAPASEPVFQPAPTSISPAALIYWGALTGTLLAMLIQSARLVRIRRLLNRAGCPPAEFTRLVIQLASELKVRPPRVVVSTEIQSPFVCALGRPVLVWPASGLASLRDCARRAIVVHELAHLARRDHWIGWIELVSSCGWWWNPLFWYVRHHLHENAELACDTWVTGLFPEARRAYAGALIGLAEIDAMKTAIGPALGVGDGSRKLFERRLVMIMGDRVRYRMGALGFIGTGLLALAVLPGCSTGFAADEPVPTNALPEQNLSGPAPEVNLSDPRALLNDGLTGSPDLPDAYPPTAQKGPAAEPSSRTLGDPLDEADMRNAPRAESPPSAETPANRAQDPAAASNDDRLKRLEDRLESLLTELREMKSGGKKPDPQQPGPSKWSKAPAGEYRRAVTAAISEAKPVTPQYETGSKTPLNMVPKTPQTITYRKMRLEAVTLQRTTYNLPPGQADVIAAFFKQSLTDEIEVRVKGDQLIVTAVPDDQTPIAGFIHLLQTRGAGAVKADGKEQNKRNDALSPKLNWRAKPGDRGEGVAVGNEAVAPTDDGHDAGPRVKQKIGF